MSHWRYIPYFLLAIFCHYPLQAEELALYWPDPPAFKQQVTVNANIIGQFTHHNQTLVFYYYPKVVPHPTVGITPSGHKEFLKFQGQHEGTHHIHVELNAQGRYIGAFSENSSIKNANSKQMAAIIAATYQSLVERLMDDIAYYEINKIPIDKGHYNAVNVKIRQLDKMAKKKIDLPRQKVNQMQTNSRQIRKIYQKNLIKPYSPQHLQCAKHQALNGHFNILRIPIIKPIQNPPQGPLKCP